MTSQWHQQLFLLLRCRAILQRGTRDWARASVRSNGGFQRRKVQETRRAAASAWAATRSFTGSAADFVYRLASGQKLRGRPATKAGARNHSVRSDLKVCFLALRWSHDDWARGIKHFSMGSNEDEPWELPAGPTNAQTFFPSFHRLLKAQTHIVVQFWFIYVCQTAAFKPAGRASSQASPAGSANCFLLRTGLFLQHL